MERPTTTMTTPLGITVVHKTYFTQSEQTQITTIMHAGATVSAEGKDIKVTDLELAQRKAVELCVVSLNDSTEKIMDTLCNEMPVSEYKAVAEAVMGLIAADLANAK